MTLERKLLIIISSLLGAGLFAFQYFIYDDIKAHAEEDLLNSAEHVRSVLMATRRIYLHQFLDSGLPLTDKTLGFLPAHALSLISKDFANWDKTGFSFNNVSDRPRNPDQQADATELQSMAYFRTHPREVRRFAPFETTTGELYYHYSQPIWVEAYCLNCHGAQATAPATIRARYDSAYGYKVGDLRGILSIKIPARVLQERIQRVFVVQLIWGLTLMLLMGLGIGWAIRRHVLKPIAELNEGIDQIATGDISYRIPALPGEFDKIGGSFNEMASAIDAKQQALFASEQRFRLLAQTATDAIILTNWEGKVLLWNDGAGKIFGYSAAEMVGRTVDRLIPELSRASHEQGMARVNRGGAPKYIGHVAELQALHRDGHEFPIEISLNTWESLGERFHVAIVRDITERKLTEAKLNTTLLEQKTMLNNPIVGIARLRDRCFVWMNRAFEEMLGYGPGELNGVPIRRFYLHQEDYDAVGQEAYALINAGGLYRTEVEFLRRGKVPIWVEISGILLDSQTQETLWVAHDITEQKRAEITLHESETKFHTMVDWTSDWEYWVKPDGRFNYMTPSVERITGYRAEEFEQNPELIYAIVHPEDRYLWERHIHHHLPEAANEEAAQLDMRIIQKGGDIRWINHACRPVCDEAGKYLGRRVSMRDITERKTAEDQIRHLAYFDPLTQLPNRRLLMDRLGQALIASNRNQEYGALLILDLDHFKNINDTQGHDVGDRLLIEVARRLTTTVRQEDTVSRLGGDEFVVMLESLGKEEQSAASQTEHVAEKIRLALTQPYALGGSETEYRSTSSIGLTLFRGHDTSVEVLLKQADVALYQAKDAGRNTVRFFNPTMQAAIDARTAMGNALRRGLINGEFRLYYQPQVSQEGDLIGAEALIRWLEPNQGLVSPAQFIPLAEESGLIVDIGQWVLDTAFAQLRLWEGNPHTRSLQLSVNVSARQFHQPDFVERVRKSLASSGANPARLKLELTESVVLDNVEGVISRMQQLNGLGVSFSLDDFGTGYSSLSYLKRLPLAQVKIDQSFVHDLADDPNDAAIVRAILAMSRSLGIQVIAEGVETHAQRDFLSQNGCTAYQGYLFGKPMPIEEWDGLFWPSDAGGKPAGPDGGGH